MSNGHSDSYAAAQAMACMICSESADTVAMKRMQHANERSERQYIYVRNVWLAKTYQLLYVCVIARALQSRTVRRRSHPTSRRRRKQIGNAPKCVQYAPRRGGYHPSTVDNTVGTSVVDKAPVWSSPTPFRRRSWRVLLSSARTRRLGSEKGRGFFECTPAPDDVHSKIDARRSQ